MTKHSPFERSSRFPLSEAFLLQMEEEFPHFSIQKKRSSLLQRMIHVFLLLLTFGQMRTYLTQYHTVLFGTLWVPDSWRHMNDTDRYILLRHERVHLKQARRMGFLKMSFLYLFWYFPLGLAKGRALIEWEAYEETLRATAELYGLTAAENERAWLVARFTGPDYGWMWPFPKDIHAWFDKTMRELEQANTSQKNYARVQNRHD